MVQVDWLEPWYEDHDAKQEPSGNVQVLRNKEKSTYVENVKPKKSFSRCYSLISKLLRRGYKEASTRKLKVLFARN